jgi:hypothetical protein
MGTNDPEEAIRRATILQQRWAVFVDLEVRTNQVIEHEDRD